MNDLTNTICLAASLVCLCQLATATETFDTEATTTANGWTGSGNTADGNNFGWSDTGNVLGSAGEAGGAFARSSTWRYFADTGIEARNRASSVLRMKGSFKLANVNFDGHIHIGYFNTGSPTNNFVGIRIEEPSGAGGNPFRGRLHVRGTGGATAAIINLAQDTTLTFDLTWTGHADGSGTLSGTLAGTRVSLTVNAGDGTFDAFGLLTGGAGSNDSTLVVNAHFDNLTYDKSVPVDMPPSIVVQPTDALVSEGQTAVFDVVAIGSTPLSYQWYSDDVAIGGATASSYTTPVITMNDSGKQFKVTVTNPNGTVTSSVAKLSVPSHRIVYHEDGKFLGWPANNGFWTSDGENLLVGFTRGDYQLQGGHNIGGNIRSWLARSTDMGQTWTAWDPDGYVGDFGDTPESQTLTSPLDFSHPQFVMRVVGIGYLASQDRKAHFFYSYDLGKTWNGPYAFGTTDIRQWPELTAAYGNNAELTPRTDYIVESSNSMLVFMSARPVGSGLPADRLFCVRTTDGGQTFNWVGWVVPPSDPYRAVMSQTVRLDNGKLISVVRRREVSEVNWVDAYVSTNNGQSWTHTSQVGTTGAHNGNPPGLSVTGNGRLVAVFGHRQIGNSNMRVAYSDDEGQTWSEPKILRDDYGSEGGDDCQDLGYPLVKRLADGKMIAIYYWSTLENLHHIAATIWDADK
jgi:hypothetical protein